MATPEACIDRHSGLSHNQDGRFRCFPRGRSFAELAAWIIDALVLQGHSRLVPPPPTFFYYYS